jgi:membrane associated rhomboid family serine protease
MGEMNMFAEGNGAGESFGKRTKPKLAPAFGEEEKLYLVKAMLLIAGIYVFRDFIYAYWKFMAFSLPALFLISIYFKSLQSGNRFGELLKEQITLIPTPYTEGGKKIFIPKATLALVLVNAAVFYSTRLLAFDQTAIEANYMFLPKVMNGWNLLVSPITSMFLHSDAGHLWGNMAFLWAFGPAVEERLGGRKFIFLYLLSGFLGDLLALAVMRLFFSETMHSLGASGAISGIMGVFLVRCYFKKLVIPIPIFGLISFKLRINSLLPLGFYFLLDLKGGFRQLAGSNSSVGYWSHIGSMLAGIFLASLLKLHRDAADESYTDSGMEAIDRRVYGESGENQLLKAIAINPKNETALLGLARIKSSFRNPEGREYFQEAIGLALRSDPKRAVEIYAEYFQVYNRMLEPDLQYRLARNFHKQGDFEGAARSLEMVVAESATSNSTREQAFVQLITILAEKGLMEAAQFRCRQFGAAFPESTLLKRAREISKVEPRS